MYSLHCQKSWCLFLCNSGSDAYQMFAVPMVMVLYLAPQFVKCQEFCLKWFETHCRNAEKSWSLNCVKYFQNWHYKFDVTVLSSNSLYDYVSDFIGIIVYDTQCINALVYNMFIWKIKWSIINPWVMRPLIWVWFRFLTFMCICIFHVDTCFNLMCPCQKHCQIVIMKDLNWWLNHRIVYKPCILSF